MKNRQLGKAVCFFIAHAFHESGGESGCHRPVSVSEHAKYIFMYNFYQIIHELILFINFMIHSELISLG